MAQHVDVEATRQKANTHLQELLQKMTGRSPQETAPWASSITALAFGPANPVGELFVTAYPASLSSERAFDTLMGIPHDRRLHSSRGEQGPSKSPSGTLRSRTSRSLLRLGKRGSKGSSEGKTSAQAPRADEFENLSPNKRSLWGEILGDPPSSAEGRSQDRRATNRATGNGTGRNTSRAVPNSSCFPATQAPPKASGSVQYQCIVCGLCLTSKGVCKRHLDEQHISRKKFKCEKCNELFSDKSDAKKHCNSCSAGVMYYITVKPQLKKVYSCGYTGEIFLSMPKYLDHLVALSEKTGDSRPSYRRHRKLLALLEQASLQQNVALASTNLFGSSNAWKNLRWQDPDLVGAIERLEYAVVHDNGTIEFDRHPKDVQKFMAANEYLYGLLRAGHLAPPGSSQSSNDSGSGIHAQQISTSSTSSDGTSTPTITSKQSLVHANVAASQVTAPSTEVAAPFSSRQWTPVDVKNKRHLSDQSRLFVPNRYPPGPSPMGTPQELDYSTPVSQYQLPQSGCFNSLPFRLQEVPMTAPDHALGTAVNTPTATSLQHVQSSITSDAASESTFAPSYREPEFLDSVAQDYNLCNSQPGFHFDLGDNTPYYGLHPTATYFHPDSIRTPSVATEQTLYVEPVENEQKYLPYDATSLHSAAGYDSFFWDQDEPDQMNHTN